MLIFRNTLHNAPAPRNISEVRSWLGLVNYYGRFLQNLSSKLNPLHNLLQKDQDFRWSQECEKVFRSIKSEITSDVVLCAYNPKLPLSLATDASPYGLGAVLSHTFPDGQERPIAYASRSLSNSEKNYSQIDKEATSIFWALKRFFRYCYGRKFTLITDHKPLVAIFSPSKSLPSMVATRMLHYAQFLQGFTYEIVYRATGDHGNADALSRLPLQLEEPKDDDNVTYYQMKQIDVVPVTQKRVAEETSRDPALKEVYNNLVLGKKLDTAGFEGKDYQFSLTNGTILRNNRVVIPQILRELILAELHTAHVGIVKMKALARSYVWWPHIDTDIEDLAQKCMACRSVQKSSKRIQHPWEYPSTPWQRVHVDFAGPFFEKYFLIVVDAHSKWPEIFQMNSMKAARTIEVLRDLFARYGLPVTLVSDNGPTFTSGEFRRFLKENGINHKFTTPYHPATNGQAERKTPNSTTGVAPCTLFLQRDIRIRLDLIRPNTIDNVKEKLNGPYPSGVQYYPGDKVQVREYSSKDKKWEFGKIVRQDGLFHYFIDVHGKLWRRHVDQIQKCNVDEKQAPKDPEVQLLNSAPMLSPTCGGPTTNSPIQTSGDEFQSPVAQSPKPNESWSEEVVQPSPSISKEADNFDKDTEVAPTVRRSSRVKKPVERLGY
ncbi:uncharacterized protein K02A2.6-like [Eupeodes corollae]|uniref:uncharacterized protein K02A2.6-like n=1 Tax=Eupeodes corollae TaxID=290404 RepID=UPI0024918475|nr:uncharacterized protein K02A2.6-like [Eupeodes corollae]